jgi:hypothetical protein
VGVLLLRKAIDELRLRVARGPRARTHSGVLARRRPQVARGHPQFPRTCSLRCSRETSWSNPRSIGSDRIGCTLSTVRMVDCIIYCTGYRISIPFLSSSLVSASGRDFPLYRRIVPPDVGGLFFEGSWTRRAGYSPSWRRKASGSPRRSRGTSACPRRSGCGTRLSAPNGAPASASPGKTPRAFGVIRTPTAGCCSPTSGRRMHLTSAIRRPQHHLRPG